jgi:hypothetical protein
VTSDAHPGLVARIGAKVTEHLDAARAELFVADLAARKPVKSRTAITTRPAISVTGRITPVMAQSGTAPSVPGPTNQVGTGHGADAGFILRRRSSRKTPLKRGRQRRGQKQNPARGRRMSVSKKHALNGNGIMVVAPVLRRAERIVQLAPHPGS